MKTTENTQFIQALQSTERFKVLPDGWIQDSFLGVDWATSLDERMEFKDAIKYCEEKGGRLPEIQELHSLVDFTKEKPASYAILNTKYDDWYWSNTRCTWNKDCLWCVSFSYGSVSHYREGFYACVRPVRASQ